MKSLARIFCLFATISIIFSAPVDIKMAQSVALGKYPGKTIDKTIMTSDNLYLTTFENGGFVLSSADDGFPAILAYSNKSPIGNNPAFSDLCDNYSRQIAAIKSENRAQHADWKLAEQNSLSKISVKSAVQPLITSRWNQAPDYNNKFPYFVLPGYTSQRPYVGCVAVVMGQLMNYNQHPARGFGKRWCYSASTDSLLEVWHDTTWYNYENMPDSLHNEYGTRIAPADQVEDVSLFLYQCAVSVDMEFFPEGSSSAFEDMMYALTSYFDYNTEMVQEIYTDYSTEDWKQMIVDELNAGYPIPYRGSGDDGGHAFLLDGYETTTNTYYHFNWGWGGYYDGWFLLSALNPAEGHDYTDNQAAIFNIRPNPDDLTRYAYTGFESIQAGWSYSGNNFYSLTGEDDYVYGFSQNGQWLKSPKIHIPNNNNVTLMVDAQKIDAGTKECRVMISYTDTLNSSFTTELGRITPGTGWSTVMFSLRPYKNTAIYLGIEYLSSSGYVILDDLTIWTPKVLLETEETIPVTHDLMHVYPNPFNPRATINFSILEAGDVQVNIFDLQGNKVLTLLDDTQEAGAYKLTWDASGFPSGLYICSLSLDHKVIESQKMLLVK